MGKPKGQAFTADQSTLWPEASPSFAKTCPPQAKDSESKKANEADCGFRCDELSKKSDRLGYSLRTFLLCEIGAATGCCLIWANLGTPARRSWWALGRSGLLTDVIACGSWATPVAQPANGTPEDFLRRKRESVARGNSMGITLSDLQMRVLAWPPPGAADADKGPERPSTRSTRKSGGGSLVTAKTRPDWNTPTAQDAKNDTLPPSQARRDSVVAQLIAGPQDQASNSTLGKSLDWPTPKAADSQAKGNGGNRKSPGLQQASREWNTPTAGCADAGATSRSGKRKGELLLGGQARSNTATRGVLNSRWVLQLLGAPSNWCDLDDDTTARLFEQRATVASRKSSKR
jgi:hypothetical protein